MNAQSRLAIRRLPLVVLIAVGAGTFAAPVSAANDIGFVSAIRGRPQAQDLKGKWIPVKLMQTLFTGETLALQKNDSIGICHETASTAYRVEGSGTLLLVETGITTQSGSLKVTPVGACATSATPQETGGVLLRSLK
jgi:hypothetical protein